MAGEAGEGSDRHERANKDRKEEEGSGKNCKNEQAQMDSEAEEGSDVDEESGGSGNDETSSPDSSDSEEGTETSSESERSDTEEDTETSGDEGAGERSEAEDKAKEDSKGGEDDIVEENSTPKEAPCEDELVDAKDVPDQEAPWEDELVDTEDVPAQETPCEDELVKPDDEAAREDSESEDLVVDDEPADEEPESGEASNDDEPTEAFNHVKSQEAGEHTPTTSVHANLESPATKVTTFPGAKLEKGEEQRQKGKNRPTEEQMRRKSGEETEGPTSKTSAHAELTGSCETESETEKQMILHSSKQTQSGDQTEGSKGQYRIRVRNMAIMRTHPAQSSETKSGRGLARAARMRSVGYEPRNEKKLRKQTKGSKGQRTSHAEVIELGSSSESERESDTEEQMRARRLASLRSSKRKKSDTPEHAEVRVSTKRPRIVRKRGVQVEKRD